MKKDIIEKIKKQLRIEIEENNSCDTDYDGGVADGFAIVLEWLENPEIFEAYADGKDYQVKRKS